METPRPTQLHLHQRSRMLEVCFDDGARYELPCELLRVYSPSAEVRGHGAGPGILVVGKEKVGIKHIEATGHYAVRLVFDDGHDSGIFTWAFLREMGEQLEQRWNAYLERLDQAGQTRAVDA